MMLHLNSQQAQFHKLFQDRLAFEPSLDASVIDAVRSVLADVRRQGDEAVIRYTGQWDGLSVSSMAQLEVPLEQMQEAFQGLDAARREALETAAERIRRFHEAQKQSSWSMDDGQGSEFGQRITPIDRAGLYVPGGKAAYPSSVLMNAIPAKVAGVRELIMVVPTPRGERNELVLAAAFLAGVDRIFTIGGAQAVGALAYGTESVPAVDKIVGPGNAYVAEAKRQVFGRVGIDMIAGPSEILVISDGSVSPQWVAMDLFSQAEHDEMAQSILLSSNSQHSLDVVEAIETLLPEMPRRAVIEKSLADRGLIVDVQSLQEACELAPLIKPYYPGTTPAAPAPLIYDHDGAPLWEVEAILEVRTKTAGKRKGKGKPKQLTEYLVRWKGFDNTQDSWEPARNLTHLEALRIFLEKQKLPNIATRRKQNP